jgi:hypothetical protein
MPATFAPVKNRENTSSLIYPLGGFDAGTVPVVFI